MKTETAYEWTLEELEDGDVIDTWQSDTLHYLSEMHATFQDENRALCLVRRVGNDRDGELSRHYAYVEGGQLPEYFQDTQIKVPARFHAELKQFIH